MAAIAKLVGVSSRTVRHLPNGSFATGRLTLCLCAVNSRERLYQSVADVDSLHQHHRVEGAFGFVAARAITWASVKTLAAIRQRISDLSLHQPHALSCSTIADNGVPVFVGFHLIFRGKYLERVEYCA